MLYPGSLYRPIEIDRLETITAQVPDRVVRDGGTKKPHPYAIARWGRHSRDVDIPFRSISTLVDYVPVNLLSRILFRSFSNGDKVKPNLDPRPKRETSMIPRELEKGCGKLGYGSVGASIAQYPERKDRFTTVSGLEVDLVYLPDDQIVAGYEDKLGFPGNFPFTRGAHPTMYRSRL